MHVQFIRFGEIEIDGQRYDHDIVIEKGRVSKRKKKSSQPFRDEYGHTPLSIHEAIPWGDQRLIVGTGVEGRLPVMAEVYQEADRRGVEIVTLPTEEACKLLSTLDEGQVHAIIHVTC